MRSGGDEAQEGGAGGTGDGGEVGGDAVEGGGGEEGEGGGFFGFVGDAELINAEDFWRGGMGEVGAEGGELDGEHLDEGGVVGAAAAEDDFVGDGGEEVEVGVGDGPGGEAGEGVDQIFDF